MKTLALLFLFAQAGYAITPSSPESFRDIKLPKTLAASKYLYNSSIVRVVDGDTLDLKMTMTVPVDKEAGFSVRVDSVNISVEDRVRLYGINAWEVHETKVAGEKEKGVAAKKWLEKVVKGKPVYVLTIKDSKEKFGRLLAILLLPTGNGNFTVLNQLLVEEGHAKYADY